MIRLFEVVRSSTGGLAFGATEMPQSNLEAYVIYDTPVEGQVIQTSEGDLELPDYITWKSITVQTSTGEEITSIGQLYRQQTGEELPTFENPFGIPDMNENVVYNALPISNNHMYTNLQSGGIRSLEGYGELYETNFSILSSLEYKVLKQLIYKLDKVRLRYPDRFEKKFSIEELLTFIEAALVEINLTPPVTKFWWTFQRPVRGQGMSNPYMGSYQGVPEILYSVIVQGAMIHALIAKGILEVDLNFSYSDQGIALTYDNSGQYSSWYDRMLQAYTQQKTLMKQEFRSKGRGVGTAPLFGMGYFNVINNLMNNGANGTFYPWWTSGNSGRAQL